MMTRYETKDFYVTIDPLQKATTDLLTLERNTGHFHEI